MKPLLEKWAAAGGSPISESDLEQAAKDTATATKFANNDKRYPVSTKAATMSSILGFYTHPPKDQDPGTAKDLEKHAKFWNIECDLAKFAAEADAPIQIKYALEDRQEIPLNDPIKAASALIASRHLLTLAEVKEAAEKILNAGLEGNELRDAMRKMACIGGTTVPKLVFAADIRMTSSRNAEEKQALQYMIDHAAEIVDDSEKLYKAACVLDEIDDIDNRKIAYEKGVYTAPENALFVIDTAAVKQAASQTIQLQNGKTVNLDSVCKEAKLEILGDDMVEAMSTEGVLDPVKVAVTLRTLPMDDADLLCSRI